MKTVLIVQDDCVGFRPLTKILTKRGGLNVKHTENAEEVMEIAHAREADLILMEVALTRSKYQGKAVGSIKIIQMLKADPKTADLPIILMIPDRMVVDRQSLLQESGADRYISQPVIDHQEFVNQIKALLPSD